MKNCMRTLALTMALLILISAGALAQAQPGAALVVGQHTVYIGQNNLIYSTERSEPLCETAATSLLYADNVRLVFVSHGTLMQLALTGENDQPTAIDLIAVGGVYVPQDGMVYYTSEDDDANLRGFSVVRGTAQPVAALAHEAGEMYASLDGLIVQSAGGASLFVPATGSFVEADAYSNGVTAQVHGGIETLLDAEGNLSLRARGQQPGEVIAVDGGVVAATALNGMVYYLKQDGEHTALYDYSYANGEKAGIGQFKSALLPQLCAAGENVYALGADGDVFALNAGTHVTRMFAELSPMPVDPVLVATDAQLLVYSAATASELTFVESIVTDEAAELPVIEPAAPAVPVETEEPVPPEHQKPEEPAESSEPTVLQRGSRGDEVLELQKILHEHGYPVGKPDGIFGGSTADAVKLMQYDLGKKETGTVNVSQLEWVKSHCPKYHAYVEMRKGDNGIRVYRLQARLKALGYLTVSPNGNYGTKTAAAVALFEKAMSEKESGVATAKVVEQIFAKKAVKAWDAFSDIKDPSAPKPPDAPDHHYNGVISKHELTAMTDWMNNHIPGKKYSEKRAVQAVQNRLCELGFLKKSHKSSSYDKNTLKAMKKFQGAYDPDRKPDGIPDEHTMALLYPARLF